MKRIALILALALPSAISCFAQQQAAPIPCALNGVAVDCSSVGVTDVVAEPYHPQPSTPKPLPADYDFHAVGAGALLSTAPVQPCVRLAGVQFAEAMYLTSEGRTIELDVIRQYAPRQRALDALKHDLDTANRDFAVALKDPHGNRAYALNKVYELTAQIAAEEEKLRNDYASTLHARTQDLAVRFHAFATAYAQKRGYASWMLDLGAKDNPAIALFGPDDLTLEIPKAYDAAQQSSVAATGTK